MSDITEGTVKEFIAAYYNTFAYSPLNISYFYDSQAQIYRENPESKIAASIEQMKEKIIPDCAKNQKIAVTNYSFVKAPNGTNVIVNGIITGENYAKFAQFFTIVSKEKIYVVSDNLKISPFKADFASINEGLDQYKSPGRKF